MKCLNVEVQTALSLSSLTLFSVLTRAGSWSLWALRQESDCGPLVHIFAIFILF